MGIAVALVVLGYVLFSFIVLYFAAFMLRKSKYLVRYVAIIGVALMWPIWLPIGTYILFKGFCKYGESGFHINEPFIVNSIAIRRSPGRESTYYYQIRGWGKEDGFLSNCSGTKCSQLNELYSKHSSWEEIRERSVIFEEKWYQEINNPPGIHTPLERKYVAGKFWLEKTGGEKCLTPLRNFEKSVCIAGEPIEDTGTTFSVDMEPYQVRNKYYPQFPFATSVEWRWFYVVKHQYHLLKGESMVARYVWYEWDFFPFFGMNDRYPCHKDGEERFFWKEILANVPRHELLQK